MLADIAARQHDAAALQHYTPLAEGLAVRYGHTLYQGIAHRAWGVAHLLASEYDDAEARLNRALELFVRLEARWQIGRTWHELGEVARALQNAEAARERYRRAIDAFEFLKANPDLQQASAALALVS